jgi:hypothetical protein
MSLGPFLSYVPPGVYTRTLTQANTANLTAGLRIPVVVGVGQEDLEIDNVELVRGSSATVDQQIVNEDVTEEWVVNATNPQNPVLGVQTGTLVTFQVRNFPITNGQGTGIVTNSANAVTVTVNGTPVAVGSVQGAKGLITLQVPTQPTDIVRVTYYFHRGDTSFTDDVSSQVTQVQAILVSPAAEPYTVVSGQSDQFTVTVNGTSSTITLGANTYTAAGFASAVNAAAIANLVATVSTDNDGLNHVQLTTTQNLVIGSGTANGLLGFSSGTATTRNQAFQVYQIPVVDGSGGGVTTTDTSKVVVKVNGTQTIPTALDGTNGIVTLSFAPAAGTTVTVTYFSNTWQDTFDYLPNALVTSILQCGIAMGRNDYLPGTDFVLSNPSSSVSVIFWGTSFVVAAGSTTPGAQPFDETLVSGLLIDDQLFLAPCSRVTNTQVIPATVSPNQFLLPEVPTTGNGRNTPLGQTLFASVTNSRQDVVTNRPDLVTVYVGRSLRDALNRGQVTVTAVDGPNRLITLQNPVPPDFQAFATFWYSRIEDDTFILTCQVPGGLGFGQYTMLDANNNAPLYQILFGTKSGLSETVQWPRGSQSIPDAFHTGAGTPVSEVVTVTFGTAAANNASFTNRNSEPYSFFSPYSATWVTEVNGTDVTTNLASAARGVVVGKHVTPSGGDITITGTALLGTFSVTASSAVVNASLNQTGYLTAGSQVTFASQPGTPYTVSTVVGTVVTLSASYTGTTNSATTAQVAPYLNLLIDGTAVVAPIPIGSLTPTAIVAAINAAIDANATFSGTAPNHLAGLSQISGGDVLFHIFSYSTPAALPGGFDSVSNITIEQGTVETVLGFTTFQSANGTPGAINKPATILGSVAGPFNITAGVNDQLIITVNGVQYTITLTAGTSVTTSTLVTLINTVPGLSGVASAGTLGNVNKLRLTSPTNNANSIISIGSGTSNATLGLTVNQTATQTKVFAYEVVDELMATSGFVSGAVAYVDQLNGLNYITFESLTVGAASSSIAFVTSGNSAFNPTTNIGLTPGTDGDNGEDATNNYVVTSSNASGTGTGTNNVGYPGQTYVDEVTGLRFTVLPASSGSYDSAGSFTLTVSETFQVSSSIPTYAIPGLETTVSNTVGVGVNDTGTVQTFDPSGVAPSIGDSYYVSYTYMKQDYTTRLYQQQKTVEANFGAVSPQNRVSLAFYLMVQNGAVLVGIDQVLTVANTNQASDASFIAAIQGLATPLPGNVKPDVIVPLATDTSVFAYLTQHCEVQSSIRNQAERMGMIGFASGTTPSNAQSVAKSLNSNRILALYPDSSDITLTDETGQSYDSIVDGTFFAAAVAGASCSPAIDVATPYTHRKILGFTSIERTLDPVTANQTAVAGVTLLDDLGNGFLRIRQGLTTNMTSILTRLPTVTQISDFTQEQSRSALDSFVGTKFLASRTNEVVVSMTALLKGLIQAEIIAAYTGVAANVDANDPTTLDFQAYYQPIFPLLYLVLTFNLRASL